jgi:polysaccharide biosynthesis/export protein
VKSSVNKSWVCAGVVWAAFAATVLAQTPQQQNPPAQQKPAPGGQRGAAPPVAGGVELPADYVIGADDVLIVVFWRDKDMTSEVVVRPDGKITLPLINEIDAANLTPDQLRDKITAAATKYMEDPTVSVVVKTINSRKVCITGAVAKPACYPLTQSMTVMQLIATAGGLQEFADSKNIIITRMQNGQQTAFPFNYKDFTKRKNLKQNIELRPGDTVVVP